MAYSNEVIEALGRLRQYASGHNRDVRQEINILDNAGVFRELDEQTGYAPAEEILETDQHGNSTVPDGGWEEYTASMERNQA